MYLCFFVTVTIFVATSKYKHPIVFYVLFSILKFINEMKLLLDVLFLA